MTIEAKVITHSISDEGIELQTTQVRYPKYIHGELMTHRTFCIAGSARIDFDLPTPAHGQSRRVHSMTIA